MIRHYLIIAYRNLLRKKVFSLINIFGLAIGMAACFFIFHYVHFESSYDRFNANAGRLYRVPISYHGISNNNQTTATNHPALGPSLKKDFPEVEEYVRIVHTSLFLNASTLTYADGGEEKSFNEEKLFVSDASFFNMFSYPMVAGDRKTCKTSSSKLMRMNGIE
ncbi:MAG: hypothetical protein EOP48_25535 [Sphingobacteriales bacterium]|nr:MAG: hypothetical protein EOP48_25535 [Sphingobacteriales bacterium]